MTAERFARVLDGQAKVVKRLWAQRMTAAQIAAVCDRPPAQVKAAIDHMRRHGGLPRKRVPRPAWCPPQHRAVYRELLRSGVDRDEARGMIERHLIRKAA